MKNRAWRGASLNIRLPADILLIPGKIIPNGRNGYGRRVCTCAMRKSWREVRGRDSGRVFVVGIETMTPEITGRL